MDCLEYFYQKTRSQKRSKSYRDILTKNEEAVCLMLVMPCLLVIHASCRFLSSLLGMHFIARKVMAMKKKRCKKYPQEVFSLFLVITMLMQSNFAFALSIYFDDITPVAVTGEDLLGLMGSTHNNYQISINGSLFSGVPSGSQAGLFGTEYNDAGTFDLQIERKWNDHLSPSVQLLSISGERPPGEIIVLNNCRHCPTESDEFTFSYTPPYETANYFAVDWIMPSSMDYIAYEYLSSFNIVLRDYDGSIFNDESIPSFTSLDAFESAYAFLDVSVSYPYDETKTARYLLNLKSENVPEPSTIILFMIGMFALQCARRRKKVTTSSPA